MGGKESKQFPITYDEATKRVTEQERRRLQDAFRRSSAANNNLSKQAFIHDVLGESVPSSLSEQIFQLVGGGRGVSFRELLTLLVLLTRGTREEKVKFIYGVLATESGTCIERAELARFCLDCENGIIPVSLNTLFLEGDKVTFEQFSAWLEKNYEDLSLAKWILSPNNAMSLISHLDTPTFYQTLAGVTHLSEQEIMELEKRFWSLVGNSTSGRIDMSIISPLVSPPMPSKLVPGLFKAFDENQDGHVDFKELACGVSAACRGPDMERQKFCFKIFDADNDGVLNKGEVELMIESMLEVAAQSKGKVASEVGEGVKDVKSMVSGLVTKEGSEQLSLEDFLVWTVDNSLPKEFAKLVFQLCHVVLGLRPSSRREEGDTVRGWLAREEQAGLCPGQVWYLLPMAWWTGWHSYVNWSGGDTGVGMSNGSLGRRKNNSALSSTLATDSSSKVVATGYTQLGDESRPGTPGGDGRSSSGRQSNSSLGTPSGSPVTPRKTGGMPCRPGMIDNSCLVQSNIHRGITVLTGEGGKLRAGGKLARGKDYELVPERLWKFLSQMYGGSPALPRQVIRNRNGQVELELNPLSARILKHQTVQRQPNVPTMVGGYSAAALQHSVGNGTSYGAASFSNSGGVGPPSVTRRYHAYQAAFSKRTAVGQIDEFLCSRLHVKHEDLRLWLYRGDESSMRQLEGENTTLEEVGFADEDSILAEIRSRDGTWPEEISSLCGDKGRTQNDRQPQVPGVTGLNNLGNTCYMNAALQVVSSTKILAEYFKTNCHLFELNRTNPLGMKGHIAKRYGDLVRDMWSGENRTIAPIKLRWTIGKYQASFSSFQQQDSQELLSFLLDGLHEDLNRVTDKPYVELKDSDGRPDDQVALEAWENHILRNKSIIVDLFHGQLKSKVTCKVCGHESVRCDPFFTLSLPLPMERIICVEAVVMLQDGSTPVKYGLTLDMEDKCSAIPPALARVSGVPPSNLVLVDIVQSQVRLIPLAEHKVRGLSGSCIYAYEVPRASCMGEGKVTNTQGGVTEQTITDIQRSVHSKLKVKNGIIPSETVENCDTTEERIACKEGGKEQKVEGAVGPGEVSWSQHCMSGISLCFKTHPASKSNGFSSQPQEAPTSNSRDPPSDSPLSMMSGSSPTSDSTALLSQSESPGPPPTPPDGYTGGTTNGGPLLTEPKRRHSRASSASSTLTAGTLDNESSLGPSLPSDLGEAGQGVVVCLHRKMMPQEFYYLSSEKYSPSLFGIPLVVSLAPGTTCQTLYRAVWEQVARLVSPLPPQEQVGHASNHAMDCDDSLGYEYPFVLKAVRSGGIWCAWCPWHRMCRGCSVPSTNSPVSATASFYAIDWDPTALHLRYLAAAERAWVEHSSVAASRRAATEPITLAKCLEAFTQEEELGEDEKYYCSACKSHQLAMKKLQIWRLPPILIIHLKRFQCVNNRWIKSHKIVDFPLNCLDPTDYLAAIPSVTLTRHKELLSAGHRNTSLLAKFTTSTSVTPIAETSEPSSLVIESDLVTTGGQVRQASICSNTDVDIEIDEDPNDSGIESNGSNGGGHPTLERGSDGGLRGGPLRQASSFSGDAVFDQDDSVVDTSIITSRPRTRQISTSLVKNPVVDDDLRDFHGHLLEEGRDPLDVRFNMYAMVCHSGVLGGGHYVSYSKTSRAEGGSNKWFCQNDSTCKEVPEGSIDKSSAYILMYERDGLGLSDYLPNTEGLRADTGDLDEEFDLDFKKQCSLM